MRLDDCDIYDEYRHYDLESWRLWYRTKRALKGKRNASGVEDYGSYLPNPDEIYARAADVRWLTENEFSPRFIQAVMWDNNPTIEEVTYMLEVRKLSKNVIENIFGPDKPCKTSKGIKPSRKGKKKQNVKKVVARVRWKSCQSNSRPKDSRR